jgi:hypothetical protein
MTRTIRQPFRVLSLWTGLLILASHLAPAASLPADVLSQLNSYNEVWHSPSTNGSPGSMPIGNGDLTANVWVENNGGDLMLYIGKSDSWSEGTRLLKLGLLRIHLFPNPFAPGLSFTQTLSYHRGEIAITAGKLGSQVFLHVWPDAKQPVLRIEAAGDQPFMMTCFNEVWRTSPYTLPSWNDPVAPSFRGLLNNPIAMPTESADHILALPDRLVWYHRNNSSWYQTILNGENLSGFQTNYPDPYLGLTFGATVKAGGFSKVNDYTLQSPSGTNFTLSLYACTAQTSTEAGWQDEMNKAVAQVDGTDLEAARINHYNWWDAFWDRSWIFVSGDADAANVTRGYLQQRWLEACQGRGKYPIKFNGGTINFDRNGQNGDYRRIGSPYWHQNTRHLYWPLLASGDFDLMLPFFNSYTNMLPLQTDVAGKLYGHGGAVFPETFNFYGLFTLENWGYGRPNATVPSNGYIKYHYQGALETLAMMLDYYDYTQDSAFATNCLVPFATQTIRFFDQHWPRVNGKLFFYPANALEMYWSCTNSTDYISGLMSDIPRLVALPARFTSPVSISEWTNCYAALPPLPMDATGSFVKPAQTYGAAHNYENPECYCIFPYRLYGLGKSNFNVGLATFNHRVIKNNKNCWSQDVIEEALVGLTDAARADVIGNFTQTDKQCHFQAFWTDHHDYVPDLDNGGAAMTALQFMLLQCSGKQINVLPAWPSIWNVDFKLCAPGNTIVHLQYQSGKITRLDVSPASRRKDLVGPNPESQPN